MDQYLGEIRMFGGTFAPVGWAQCAGQLLQISLYEALYNLIGTTYGGDGVSTFGLPDLRGRVPVHHGSGYVMGQSAGTERVALNSSQNPPHSHTLYGSVNPATSNSPQNAVAAAITGGGTTSAYDTAQPHSPIAPSAISAQGLSQPHENMQPYLCITFIIALEGVYPPQG
jgi:microcystin-dependent protein